MEGTCKKQECKHWKRRGCDLGHFTENWWVSESGEQQLVADCAPVRTMFMVRDLYNRLIGVEKAVESQRNENVRVATVLSVLDEAVKKVTTPPVKELLDANS